MEKEKATKAWLTTIVNDWDDSVASEGDGSENQGTQTTNTDPNLYANKLEFNLQDSYLHTPTKPVAQPKEVRKDNVELSTRQFLWSYTQGWVLTSIMTVAVAYYEKLRRYEEAVGILDLVLDLPYCPHRVGHWYVQSLLFPTKPSGFL